MIIFDAIVTAVTTVDIIVETEIGDPMTLPRYSGETPAVGSAIRIDMTTGVPKIYSTPPVSTMEKVDRFLNFNADSKEAAAVEVPDKTGTSALEGVTPSFGPFTPYSFLDTPVGAKTVAAGNGNLLFAGPTAVGMAVSPSAKMILKDNGAMEIVTSHFVSVQGRTVLVSSFRENLSIEIDILNVDVESKVDFSSIKKVIAEDIMGEDAGKDKDGKPTAAVPPLTYETSFKKRLKDTKSFKHPAFIKMFGVHIAELLCSVQWERVRFRGSEKTFRETFAGIAMFDSYIGYCKECYNTEIVKELEFFVVPTGDIKTPAKAPASVFVPACEEQVADKIYELAATINDEMYTITAMNIVTSDGTKIEYVARKRVYSFSHGILAKKSFTSADQQGVFSNNIHIDVNQMSFSNLNFSTNTTDFCDNDTALPTINWDGDFVLSVTGSLSMASTEEMTLASAIETVLAGGTRGIKINSAGSSAITF